MATRSRRGVQELAGLQHWHACLQVLAGGAYVLAGLLTGRDRDARALHPADFLHHHRVRARRHHRAGHDAHALSRSDTSRERLAGKRSTDLLQSRFILQIGKTNGKTIHRRVVVAGHVDRGHDRLRQNAAERFPGRNLFNVRYLNQTSSDRRDGLVHAQRVRVVAVHAAHRLGDRAHADRVHA
jgi:hypothetical protein